ncbi:peptidylprolyl isomerase [Frigidibacter oleivorans]|uniref:peptidylprolyl isomerase n=1 Tax=Frigidibacter oleivorans TaxID=2487129 RepID=UPI000F8CC31B|nr:peptidylprolyl isomerase [Frigidibacter oleivorans]
MAKGVGRRGASTVVWLLVAMLIIGLGGFGVTNFGGSVDAVARVGDREITVEDYARALQTELRALTAQVGQPVTLQQAAALGLDTSVRQRLIAEAALDAEADAAGLSAGDAQVRDQVLAIGAFQGLDGQFDREAYRMALRQQGMTEGEFEQKLRDESARVLLQAAVTGGTAAPAAFVDALADWQGETRSFRIATLTPAALTEPVPAPTEEQLTAFHAETPEPFTAPETRVVSYAWLSPEMVLDEVQLDEAALREAYDARIDEFQQPERRMVERLVFGTEDEAAAARARVESGEISFEDLVNARGLTLEDVDLGEVTEAELGAAGEGVFALEAPGIAGPLPSDLGPALYAMNAILLPQDVPFEEARETLTEEVAIDRARRMVADRAQELDDLLAGGATLEQLADEAGMEFGTVDVTAEGGGEGIAAYAAFREAALAATEGDFPALAQLEDGGLFALRLDEIRPPAVRPLDEVRDLAVTLWTEAETARRLLAEAETVAAAPDPAAALAERGLTAEDRGPVTRDAFVEELPPGGLDQVFAMAEGEARAIAGQIPVPGETGTPVEPQAHVVLLTAIAPAGGETEGQLRTAIANQARQSLAQDSLDLFVTAVESGLPIRLDQAAINAVHAQIP